MITLKRHRAADIEAPCLHSDNENTTWKAHLFNHDTPTVITEDVVGTKYANTGMIVFYFSVEQVDLFDDGDKLDIEIWPTNNETDMYWKEKAFKVEDSYVPSDEDVTFEYGYLVGATVDEDGYIIANGIDADGECYLILR